MAKFVTDDGKGGISGDALMRQLREYCHEDMIIPQRKYHTDVEKLKIPTGKCNRHRLNNVSDYDLLTHIQKTLSLTNRCIIEMITNEDHKCINTNPTIQNRIRQFAADHITEEFKKLHPRASYTVKMSEDVYDIRDETDEEWFDRLCHMYMHQFYPNMLQQIKCEECIQKWLNSDKW